MVESSWPWSELERIGDPAGLSVNPTGTEEEGHVAAEEEVKKSSAAARQPPPGEWGTEVEAENMAYSSTPT